MFIVLINVEENQRKMPDLFNSTIFSHVYWTGIVWQITTRSAGKPEGLLTVDATWIVCVCAYAWTCVWGAQNICSLPLWRKSKSKQKLVFINVFHQTLLMLKGIAFCIEMVSVYFQRSQITCRKVPLYELSMYFYITSQKDLVDVCISEAIWPLAIVSSVTLHQSF